MAGLLLAGAVCLAMVGAVRGSVDYLVSVDAVLSGGGASYSAAYLERDAAVGQEVLYVPAASLGYLETGGVVQPWVLSAGEGEGEGEGEGQAQNPWHTADQNHDTLINLSELLRVIQFFNSQGYHCQAGTEDGYAPGPGDAACTPHDSDYNPQDWFVNLSELLRVIQFFNSQGYHYCPEQGTEDGFCPGPG